MKLTKIAALLAIIIATSAFYYPNFRSVADQKSAVTQATTTEANNTVPTEIVGNISGLDPGEFINTYTNPAIGKIEQFRVTSSTGTVILLPQRHQSPGSQAADKTNDVAEVTQNQIYQVISELYQKLNVTLVMAEGDLYGEVPGEKITYLNKLIDLRNQFATQLVTFQESSINEGVDRNWLSSVVTSLNTYLKSLDREIILAGAPYKLKAEGTPITLIGAENKTTLNKSAELVRNYTYLQDRKQQLARNTAPQTNPSSFASAYLSLLAANNDPVKQVQRNLSSINQSYAKNKRLASIAKQLENSFNNIIGLKQQNIIGGNNSPLPSREDNPYKNIMSTRQIDQMIKEDESKIETLIIDQRNKETADFALQAIKTESVPTMILQYGAGHVSGLVKELNAKGLSVIVITPKAILK